MSETTNQTDRNSTTELGKYVLDSLSFGMYNHPYMILREYIQNSVDAIDAYNINKKPREKYSGAIEITINGKNKSIKITDNGEGIGATKAWNTLHDLGKSEKDSSKNRGFRGIGRLGGLGCCDQLIFQTKARSDKKYSVSVWDCKGIRDLINGRRDVNVTDIISESVEFYQDNYLGDSNDHYFSVEMINLSSNRGLLLNVPKIKEYLSEVAPVPFDTNIFDFAKDIDAYLRTYVPRYEVYSISVNGETINKPYRTKIGINDNGVREILGIKFIDLIDDNGTLAYGWLGELEYTGVIWPSSQVDGIRLRHGNILVGNKDALAELYREKRFNNYLLGEIHVVDPRLIPNSRRDDFEDNDARDALHSCFLREVGLPYSKLIRDVSNKRSQQRKLEDVDSILERATSILKHGYVTESQRQDIIERLNKLNGDKPETWTDKDISQLISRINDSRSFLELSNKSNEESVILYQKILEKLYTEFENKAKIESIIRSLA